MTSKNDMVLSLEHMPKEKVYRIGNDVLMLDELVVADAYLSHFRTCRGTKCQFRGRVYPNTIRGDKDRMSR